jgi:hypothetical protein
MLANYEMQRLKNRELNAARRGELIEIIIKGVDELNTLDAGEWVHTFNTANINEMLCNEKIASPKLTELNKKLVAAASEILSIAIKIDQEAN